MGRWTDVGPGEAPPDDLYALVEVAQGSRLKHEADLAAGVLRLSRVLPLGLAYPVSYGCLPAIPGKDGDPLDVLVLASAPLLPGTLVRVRPVGELRLRDEGEDDAKLLGACLGDPLTKSWRRLGDVDGRLLEGVADFFRVYKRAEGEQDEVRVLGWRDEDAARSRVVEALAAPL